MAKFTLPWLLLFAAVAAGRDLCKLLPSHTGLKCASLNSYHLPNEMFFSYEEDVPGFSGDIKKLQIVSSNISVLQNEAFKFYPFISEILLRNVSLKSIEERAFSGLVKVKWVDLSYNLLQKIPVNLFKDTAVRHLTLEGNTELEIPTNGPILNATKLIWLSLRKCNIQHLPGSAFQTSSALSHLDLSHNKLEMLPQEAFANLTHLIYLDLSENLFQTIDYKIFQSIPTFPKYPAVVILAGNNWNCDCRIANVIQWATQSSKDGTWSRLAHSSRLRKNVECREPRHLNGISWNVLRELVDKC